MGKKIVINRCFGGFGLSTVAMKQLIKRGCMALRIESEEEYSGGMELPESLNQRKDAGDGYTHHPLVTDVLYKDGKVYRFDERAAGSREDATLVQAVEELGKEASGRFADLKVVEIPYGVKYTIEEYDGNEHVAEAHRTWSGDDD